MIAVIYFPGNNCELETQRAVKAVGLECDILRWNTKKDISPYQGYILCGGWSYEDRIRAGVISSRDPIMQEIKKQSIKAKPILGICNGAQVLVESGLVPNTNDQQKPQAALAPNHNNFLSGFYCTWTNIKVNNTKTAFTSNFEKDEIIRIPIAHAEGRFTTDNPEKLKDHIAFQYCDEQGNLTDPNGSFMSAAGLINKQGNVLAMMPHPERACFNRQLPYHEQVSFKDMISHAKAMKIFESMRDYLG